MSACLLKLISKKAEFQRGCVAYLRPWRDYKGDDSFFQWVDMLNVFSFGQTVCSIWQKIRQCFPPLAQGVASFEARAVNPEGA